MKKILLAAIILCSSVTAFASIKNEKAVTAKFKVTTNLETKKANLTFIPSGNGKVTVKILNANGVVIFQEQVKSTEGFSRPYDLSKLQSAEYTLVVMEGTNEFTEKVSLTQLISSPKVGAFSAAATVSAPGKVTLKILQEKVSPVFVAIKDYQGNTLYSTAISNQASFTQNFDLSKVNAAVYFEVKASNGSKTIEL